MGLNYGSTQGRDAVVCLDSADSQHYGFRRYGRMTPGSRTFLRGTAAASLSMVCLVRLSGCVAYRVQRCRAGNRGGLVCKVSVMMAVQRFRRGTLSGAPDNSGVEIYRSDVNDMGL